MSKKIKRYKEPKAPKKKGFYIRLAVRVALGLAFAAVIGVLMNYIRNEDIARALAEVSPPEESPIKNDRDKAKEYANYAGFQKVAENEYLILYADCSTAEISVEQKSTGKIWYSNPQDRNESGIIGNKNLLKSQLTYTYLNLEADAELDGGDTYNRSVRVGCMDFKMTENGIEFIYGFPLTGIRIPIRYTLNGTTLEISIPEEDIEETWSERCVLASVELLPYFGASGQDETGYMVVPDGSGAIIPLNSDNYRYGSYRGSIYGYDKTISTASFKSQYEQIRMPVFGMKTDAGAYLAVITEGATQSEIITNVSRKGTSYNQMWTKITYRALKSKGLASNYDQEAGINSINEHTDSLLEGQDYTITYFFLEEENSDYNGMAQVYKEYLKAEGQLAESGLTEEPYVVLDVYGAVGFNKYVMGVSRYVVTKLTGYTELCDMVKELKEKGVENLIVNYIGSIRGGIEYQVADEVEIEPVLGTKKEFQKMLQYMEEENVILFLETDPMRMCAEGDGYSKYNHGARTFFGEFLYHQKSGPSGIAITMGRGGNYLKASLVPEVIRKFSVSANKWGVSNIAVGLLGDYLYTDLSSGTVSTAQLADMAAEALTEVRTAGGRVMVHGGNLYTAAYADVISDVPISGSSYDITTAEIPFYQMVLGEDVLLATKPINDSSDYEYMFLKTLETGMHLKYNLMAADSSELVGTIYSYMVSYAKGDWLDTIAAQYQKKQEIGNLLGAESILAHEVLADGVVKTVYSSGKSILINYTAEAYNYEGIVIDPNGYAVVEGGNQE